MNDRKMVSMTNFGCKKLVAKRFTDKTEDSQAFFIYVLAIVIVIS